MIMINAIGGASRFAAVVADAAPEPINKPAPSIDSKSADLNGSVAAYLSLPGFNPSAHVDTSEAGDASHAVGAVDDASPTGKAAAAEHGGLKDALNQFDDGLKRLERRPETQIFQAKFGLDGVAVENLVSPDPLPGVSEDGVLGVSGKDHPAADLNNDGKISEDERRRYQLPITYRSSERSTDALADGPSAFSLTEANRAYGVVAAARA
jgi:hypothetical protein